MANRMLDSLFCECGGQYDHVDEESQPDGQVTDAYHCKLCGTTCYVTWDAETEAETGRHYTIDCPECGAEISPEGACWHCEHLNEIKGRE